VAFLEYVYELYIPASAGIKLKVGRTFQLIFASAFTSVGVPKTIIGSSVTNSLLLSEIRKKLALAEIA
jgi:hypothetical protein